MIVNYQFIDYINVGKQMLQLPRGKATVILNVFECFFKVEFDILLQYSPYSGDGISTVS